jgi:uncharacterized membrane protein YkvA (DUF1232 family)
MKSWESSIFEHGATNQVRLGAQMPVTQSGLLHLVTTYDVQELRNALAQGRLPVDFEAKLAKLTNGSLSDQYVEQNSRLFCALLMAAFDTSFTEAAPSDRERLLRVLAYVRKDDDAIPDYLPGGFIDDQQQVRAAAMELRPLLEAFKVWRLRHQVPAMWQRHDRTSLRKAA